MVQLLLLCNRRPPFYACMPFLGSNLLAAPPKLLRLRLVAEPASLGPVGEGNRRPTMAQTLRDFLKQVQNLPPDTLLCVAEVDEAFAAHVEEIEIVENAKSQNRKAQGTEAVELGNGSQRVVVIRW
jgi:hypothetical protein